MNGTVTSYTGSTGEMIGEIVSYIGGGPYSDWTVNLGGGTGAAGTSGTSGVEGHLAIWVYSGTTVTTADPGSGKFTFDSPSWVTFPTTTIAISDNAHNPIVNFGEYLDSIAVGSVLKFIKTGDSTVFKYLQITEVLPLQSGYERFEVSQIATSIPGPTTGDEFNLVTTGIAGATGSSGTSGISGNEFTYSEDLIVSLSNGKTFGRYLTGETIPASGKTPSEVIELAIAEPLSPTVTLTSATVIPFNQTAISNVLAYEYEINTLDATVDTVLLEWQRNNTGGWTTLSTDTATPTGYTHTMTDTSYNVEPFNYQYTVTDTAGGITINTLDITPVAYVPPTISLSVVGATLTSPETDLKREVGNITSTLSGTITRNSDNVDLISYQLQYQKNGGTWTDIGGPIAIGAASGTIASTGHTEASLFDSTSIGYRAQAITGHVTTNGAANTVNFLYIIFYSSVASEPTNSAGVRAITTRIFTDGINGVGWNLNTGTVNYIYTIAMPATLSTSEILDLDALNLDITVDYINSTFNVNDYYGTAVSYHVYTMTNSIAYTPSHRHQITRI